jgi:RNA polymerase sigma-70 factor (ECF subfamily)
LNSYPQLLGVALSESRDDAWFAAEVQPHERALRRYLQRQFPRLRDVDDIVQESYVRILQARIHGVVTNPRAYLFSTARNAVIDLLRRNRVEFVEDVAGLRRSEPDPGTVDGTDAGALEERTLLKAAIADLPARCRTVFVMRRLQGCSRREIAEALGISEHTVNTQLAIAIMRCRKFLRAQGIGR